MRRYRLLLLLVLTVVAVCSFGTPASATGPTVFIDTLFFNGGQENPSVATPSTGTGWVSVNTTANTLDWHFTYTPLTSAVNNAHIHGMANRGANAGVLFNILPFVDTVNRVSKGTWTFSEAQQADILAGRTYFNVHTVNNSGGEIRAQIDNLEQTKVPTLNQWGMIALTLLLLAGGAVFLMRRRALA